MASRKTRPARSLSPREMTQRTITRPARAANRSVEQRAGHNQGIFTAPRRRIIIAAPANLVETEALIQPVGRVIRSPYFQKTPLAAPLAGSSHQMFEQRQPQARPLISRGNGDIQQVSLIENQIDHAMTDLLISHKHYPALIRFHSIYIQAACPGMAKGSMFDSQNSVDIRFGHGAEIQGVTHYWHTTQEPEESGFSAQRANVASLCALSAKAHACAQVRPSATRVQASSRQPP